MSAVISFLETVSVAVIIYFGLLVLGTLMAVVFGRVVRQRDAQVPTEGRHADTELITIPREWMTRSTFEAEL